MESPAQAIERFHVFAQIASVASVLHVPMEQTVIRSPVSVMIDVQM
jgi:hypothetical protein